MRPPADPRQNSPSNSHLQALGMGAGSDTAGILQLSTLTVVYTERERDRKPWRAGVLRHGSISILFQEA